MYSHEYACGFYDESITDPLLENQWFHYDEAVISDYNRAVYPDLVRKRYPFTDINPVTVIVDFYAVFPRGAPSSSVSRA